MTVYLRFIVSGLLSEAGEENPGLELEHELELQVASTSAEGKDSSTEHLEKQTNGQTGQYFYGSSHVPHLLVRSVSYHLLVLHIYLRNRDKKFSHWSFVENTSVM